MAGVEFRTEAGVSQERGSSVSSTLFFERVPKNLKFPRDETGGALESERGALV